MPEQPPEQERAQELAEEWTSEQDVLSVTLGDMVTMGRAYLSLAHKLMEAKERSRLQTKSHQYTLDKLMEAERALHECSIHSGADVSDGPRTKYEYVVDDVKELRAAYDEACDEDGRYREALERIASEWEGNLGTGQMLTEFVRGVLTASDGLPSPRGDVEPPSR